MRSHSKPQYTPAVPDQSVAVVVSDAHLSHAADGARNSFHRFLQTVPDLGAHLLINGDLFDFWFEYHHVIPRCCFPTLALLSEIRRAGVAITVTGGNHDRWGLGFWESEMGATFVRSETTLELAGWHAWVTHGDGIAELESRARWAHAVTRHPLTERLFRLIHPDFGFGLVHKMSAYLEAHRDPELINRAAAAQARFAQAKLSERPELDLVVMGHTHRAELQPAGENRWYLNPGGWVDGGNYAVISRDGPELRRFE